MQPATSVAATTPLRRLAMHSTTTCSAAASEYGKCILATYTDVHKDTCKKEFAKFGACLREAVRPTTSLSSALPHTDRHLDEAEMVIQLGAQLRNLQSCSTDGTKTQTSPRRDGPIPPASMLSSTIAFLHPAGDPPLLSSLCLRAPRPSLSSIRVPRGSSGTRIFRGASGTFT